MHCICIQSYLIIIPLWAAEAGAMAILPCQICYPSHTLLQQYKLLCSALCSIEMTMSVEV